MKDVGENPHLITVYERRKQKLPWHYNYVVLTNVNCQLSHLVLALYPAVSPPLSLFLPLSLFVPKPLISLD